MLLFLLRTCVTVHWELRQCSYVNVIGSDSNPVAYLNHIKDILQVRTCCIMQQK